MIICTLKFPNLVSSQVTSPETIIVGERVIGRSLLLCVCIISRIKTVDSTLTWQLQIN